MKSLRELFRIGKRPVRQSHDGSHGETRRDLIGLWLCNDGVGKRRVMLSVR